MNGNTCLSMETKKTREFVIGVLPKGMVTFLGNEIFKPLLSDFGAPAAARHLFYKPVLAREREARLIFESCGMVLCPVPNSFLPQICEDM